jgi:glycyl-tRNA synthetase
MEMEYFVKPGKEDEAFEYWIDQRMNWYINVLGIKKENLRVRSQEKDELAHYAKGCVDIEYNFPVGWSEIEGIASRGDFDLSQHQKFSGEDLNYFDDQTKEKYIPYVIEPSCGLDRTFLAVLCDAFTEVEGGRTTTTEGNKEKEFLLKLSGNIAPVKVAILPLVKNKEEITKKAREVYDLLKENFSCQYDEAGAIGRRYRRQDEIGTPFAVTIDFESIANEDVTLRDRDTMDQKRVKISDLISIINEN